MSWSWAVLVSALAVPPVEPPKPRALEVQWQAPPGCPDGEEIRARIAALVVDPDGEGTLEVEGRIEESPGGYRLSLRTRYEDLADERVLEDADCDALADVTALTVAVSIAPEVVEEAEVAQRPEAEAEPVSAPIEPVLQPAPIPEPEPEPEPEPAPEPRRDDPPRRRPVAAVIGLGPSVEFGALPGLSGGPRLSLGLRWQRASVAAYGLYGLPRRTESVDEVSGLVQMGAAGVRGCGLLGETVRIPLCGLIEGGGLRVESRGPVPTRTLRYPWSALGARAGVERRWGRVGIHGALEALVPINRAEVTVGEQTSFDTFPVSLRAIVGLQIFLATDSA